MPACAGSWPWIGTIVLLVAATGAAFVFTDYQLFQFTMVAVYAHRHSRPGNLVTGYNGQVSLGHGAFYAVGAYVTAILMAQIRRALLGHAAGRPPSSAPAFGFVLGLPALRLGGLYLALTTFALAVATPQLLKYKAIDFWTGGVQGITID